MINNLKFVPKSCQSFGMTAGTIKHPKLSNNNDTFELKFKSEHPENPSNEVVELTGSERAWNTDANLIADIVKTIKESKFYSEEDYKPIEKFSSEKIEDINQELQYYKSRLNSNNCYTYQKEFRKLLNQAAASLEELPKQDKFAAFDKDITFDDLTSNISKSIKYLYNCAELSKNTTMKDDLRNLSDTLVEVTKNLVFDALPAETPWEKYLL